VGVERKLDQGTARRERAAVNRVEIVGQEAEVRGIDD
jgi:hypothetical protein